MKYCSCCRLTEKGRLEFCKRWGMKAFCAKTREYRLYLTLSTYNSEHDIEKSINTIVKVACVCVRVYEFTLLCLCVRRGACLGLQQNE